MPVRPSRLAVLALACLIWSPAAWSQPIPSPEVPQAAPVRALSIDDLLAMESFGMVSIDPSGRWAVYERRGAYGAAPRFDRGHRSIWAVTGLYLVDLHAAQPRPVALLPAMAEQGVVLGPWSPTGRRLLVYRLRGDRLEAGVVDLHDLGVRWTGLTPDMPLTGDFVGWRDDDRFVLTRRDDDSLPWILRHDGASQTVTTEAWRRMAAGREPARTIVDTTGGVDSTPAPTATLTLVEVTASSGALREILRGPILDVALSPSGASVAVLTAGDRVAPPPGPQRGNTLPTRGRLRMIALDGLPTLTPPMVDLDVAPHLLRWTAASDAVLVWARRDDQGWEEGRPVRITTNGAMTLFDVSGLEPLPAGQGIDGLRAVRADWSGSTPVLYARAPGVERFDWYALTPDRPPQSLTTRFGTPPARVAANTGAGLLFFADGALWHGRGAGPLERLSPVGATLLDSGVRDVMAPLRVQMNDAPRRTWVFGKDASGGGLILSLDAPPRAVSTSPLNLSSYVAASDRRAVISLVRNRGAETLELGQPARALSVDSVNAGFADLAFAPAVPVPHLNRLGEETRSWLYLPVGVAPSAVKGIVVMIYPGSIKDGAYLDPRSLLFSLRPELIAAAGFAVLSPAMPERGETGASAAAGYVESVDLAVAAARAQTPTLPEGRTAVLGHSFGGTAALAIAARSDRYQAYVAWSAVTDVLGFWGEFWPVARALPQEGTSLQSQMGWSETGQGAIGAPPWAATDAYVQASPYYSAHSIRSPVLLITGDRDFVPLSQAERVFTVLHRQRQTARLVTYWGEGHSNWSPADIRDLYDQITDWLDETLGQDQEVDGAIPSRDVQTRSQPSSAAATMMSP